MRISFDGKKKRVAIISGIIMLVAALAILLYLKSGLSIDDAQRILDETVEKTVETVDDSNLLKDVLGENLSIIALDVKKVDDGYECVCEVTSVDCADVLIQYMEEISSEEIASGNEIIARLKTVVQTSPIVKRQFAILFIKTEDGYTPIFTEELVNFCSGNMKPVQQYLLERMEGEEG